MSTAKLSFYKSLLIAVFLVVNTNFCSAREIIKFLTLKADFHEYSPQQIEKEVLKLEHLPPAEAARHYMVLRYSIFAKKGKAELDRLEAIYHRNKKVRPWLIKVIKSTPHSIYTSDNRFMYFNYLLAYKERWVFELLGQTLNSSPKFIEEPFSEELTNSMHEVDRAIGYVTNPRWRNPDLATYILDEFKIKNASVRENKSPTGVAGWKLWWDVNKTKLDRVAFVDGGRLNMSQQIILSDESTDFEKENINTKSNDSK